MGAFKRKMSKKILWITDDQIDHKDTYIKKFQEVGKLILIDKFTLIDNIDFLIVDYSFIWGESNSLIEHKTVLKVLKTYYKRKIPIVWSGGLGGTSHYEEDCKKTMSDEKWMHNIESVSLQDLLWYVDNKLHGVSGNSSHD